MVSPDLD